MVRRWVAAAAAAAAATAAAADDSSSAPAAPSGRTAIEGAAYPGAFFAGPGLAAVGPGPVFAGPGPIVAGPAFVGPAGPGFVGPAFAGPAFGGFAPPVWPGQQVAVPPALAAAAAAGGYPSGSAGFPPVAPAAAAAPPSVAASGWVLVGYRANGEPIYAPPGGFPATAALVVTTTPVPTAPPPPFVPNPDFDLAVVGRLEDAPSSPQCSREGGTYVRGTCVSSERGRPDGGSGGSMSSAYPRDWSGSIASVRQNLNVVVAPLLGMYGGPVVQFQLNLLQLMLGVCGALHGVTNALGPSRMSYLSRDLITQDWHLIRSSLRDAAGRQLFAEPHAQAALLRRPILLRFEEVRWPQDPAKTALVGAIAARDVLAFLVSNYAPTTGIAEIRGDGGVAAWSVTSAGGWGAGGAWVAQGAPGAAAAAAGAAGGAAVYPTAVYPGPAAFGGAAGGLGGVPGGGVGFPLPHLSEASVDPISSVQHFLGAVTRHGSLSFDSVLGVLRVSAPGIGSVAFVASGTDYYTLAGMESLATGILAVPPPGTWVPHVAIRPLGGDAQLVEVNGATQYVFRSDPTTGQLRVTQLRLSGPPPALRMGDALGARADAVLRSLSAVNTVSRGVLREMNLTSHALGQKLFLRTDAARFYPEDFILDPSSLAVNGAPSGWLADLVPGTLSEVPLQLAWEDHDSLTLGVRLLNLITVPFRRTYTENFEYLFEQEFVFAGDLENDDARLARLDREISGLGAAVTAEERLVLVRGQLRSGSLLAGEPIATRLAASGRLQAMERFVADVLGRLTRLRLAGDQLTVVSESAQFRANRKGALLQTSEPVVFEAPVEEIDVQIFPAGGVAAVAATVAGVSVAGPPAASPVLARAPPLPVRRPLEFIRGGRALQEKDDSTVPHAEAGGGHAEGGADDDRDGHSAFGSAFVAPPSFVDDDFFGGVDFAPPPPPPPPAAVAVAPVAPIPPVGPPRSLPSALAVIDEHYRRDAAAPVDFAAPAPAVPGPPAPVQDLYMQKPPSLEEIAEAHYMRYGRPEDNLPPAPVEPVQVRETVFLPPAAAAGGVAVGGVPPAVGGVSPPGILRDQYEAPLPPAPPAVPADRWGGGVPPPHPSVPLGATPINVAVNMPNDGISGVPHAQEVQQDYYYNAAGGPPPVVLPPEAPYQEMYQMPPAYPMPGVGMPHEERFVNERVEYGVPENYLPPHPMPVQPLPVQSLPVQHVPVHSVPVHSVEVHPVPAHVSPPYAEQQVQYDYDVSAPSVETTVVNVNVQTAETSPAAGGVGGVVQDRRYTGPVPALPVLPVGVQPLSARPAVGVPEFYYTPPPPPLTTSTTTTTTTTTAPVVVVKRVAANVSAEPAPAAAGRSYSPYEVMSVATAPGQGVLDERCPGFGERLFQLIPGEYRAGGVTGGAIFGNTLNFPVSLAYTQRRNANALDVTLRMGRNVTFAVHDPFLHPYVTGLQAFGESPPWLLQAEQTILKVFSQLARFNVFSDFVEVLARDGSRLLFAVISEYRMNFNSYRRGGQLVDVFPSPLVKTFDLAFGTYAANVPFAAPLVIRRADFGRGDGFPRRYQGLISLADTHRFEFEVEEDGAARLLGADGLSSTKLSFQHQHTRLGVERNVLDLVRGLRRMHAIDGGCSIALASDDAYVAFDFRRNDYSTLYANSAVTSHLSEPAYLSFDYVADDSSNQLLLTGVVKYVNTFMFVLGNFGHIPGVTKWERVTNEMVTVSSFMAETEFANRIRQSSSVSLQPEKDQLVFGSMLFSTVFNRVSSFSDFRQFPVRSRGRSIIQAVGNALSNLVGLSSTPADPEETALLEQAAPADVGVTQYVVIPDSLTLDGRAAPLDLPPEPLTLALAFNHTESVRGGHYSLAAALGNGAQLAVSERLPAPHEPAAVAEIDVRALADDALLAPAAAAGLYLVRRDQARMHDVPPAPETLQAYATVQRILLGAKVVRTSPADGTLQFCDALARDCVRFLRVGDGGDAEEGQAATELVVSPAEGGGLQAGLTAAVETARRRRRRL